MSTLTPLRRIGLAFAALFMVFSFVPGIAEAEVDPAVGLEVAPAPETVEPGATEAEPELAGPAVDATDVEAPPAPEAEAAEPEPAEPDADQVVEIELPSEPQPEEPGAAAAPGPSAPIDGGAVAADGEDVGPSVAALITPFNQSIRSGTEVTYSILVVNDGTVDFDSVSVSAPQTPICSRADLGSLPAGGDTIYECTVLDVTSDITNVVEVSVQLAGSQEVLQTTSNESIITVRDLRLEIDMNPASQSVPAGGTAEFEISVYDIGEDPLTSADFVSVPGAPDCDREDVVSFPFIYTCEVTNVTESFTSVASVEVWISNTDQYVVSSEPAVVTVVSELPEKIAIEISPAAQTIDEGGTATFDIEVSSPDMYALRDLVVTDPALPDCDAEYPIVLQAGTTWTYSCEVVDPPDGFTHSATVVADALLASEQDVVVTHGWESAEATSNAAAVTIRSDVPTTIPTTTPTTVPTEPTVPTDPTTVDPTPTTDPSDVQAGGQDNGGSTAGTPPGSANTGVDDGTLARTGNDSLGLVAIGLALVLFGATTLIGRRRIPGRT